MEIFMKFQFKSEEDIVAVTMSGNVMGGPDFEPFHAKVKDELAGGARKFLFDFGGVKWINSTGVGIMVSIYTTVKAGEGRMVICRPNERVRGTYFISQVDSIFDTFDTIEEGRTALAGA